MVDSIVLLLQSQKNTPSPYLNRRIHLLICIITFITSEEDSCYSISSLHTLFFWAGNRLWFLKSNSHETVIRLKVLDGPSDSVLIYNTLESVVHNNAKDKTKMLSRDVIQLPGNILWTGVAMLISWRCFSVSVWNRRSVDPDVKAIQIPTPATAMWEMTIPSSWWASKWLCKKNNDSGGDATEEHHSTFFISFLVHALYLCPPCQGHVSSAQHTFWLLHMMFKFSCYPYLKIHHH